MTEPTFEGIAGTLDRIEAKLDGVSAAQPKPINAAGYTLKEAKAYASANSLTFKISEDGNSIGFYGSPGLGNTPMFIKNVPLLD